MLRVLCRLHNARFPTATFNARFRNSETNKRTSCGVNLHIRNCQKAPLAAPECLTDLWHLQDLPSYAQHYANSSPRMVPVDVANCSTGKLSRCSIETNRLGNG